jgi:hypothetical protein
MFLEAPPPRRHISSAPISLDAASNIVSTYLTHSETHAHLHPDATITPEGINFNAQGGAMGNPLMHHLRRVAAGLRGEYLEPDKTLDEEEDGVQDGAPATGAVLGSKKPGKGRKEFAAVDEDWQDMASYQAEQGTEIDELGPRTNVIQEGGEEPEVRASGGSGREGTKRKKEQVDEEGAAVGGRLDNAARKKAKKERQKQEKREKEQNKKNKNKNSD